MSVNGYLSEEERSILESATVGIAGAGGLGSNCAAHLVRSGVRHFVIADFDVVSASNLNRQFFFCDQVGQKKVDALRENLLRIEPALQLEMHDIKITTLNIHEIFRSCCIVAEAFDTTESKSMFLRALSSSKKMLVSVSGIAGWGKSNEIQLKKVGKNLILIGDFKSGVDAQTLQFPASPRVGIAAAMQANSIIASLLGHPL
ncbi:MAG: sulfur carrier protein ThiS adenylyltransferase ThiF [Victivallaceae bacterium]|nr:sulfur carrier protein ThiS adenylyltransferase ThiF [Victivallaceae bacterium]